MIFPLAGDFPVDSASVADTASFRPGFGGESENTAKRNNSPSMSRPMTSTLGRAQVGTAQALHEIQAVVSVKRQILTGPFRAVTTARRL